MINGILCTTYNFKILNGIVTITYGGTKYDFSIIIEGTNKS